MSTTDSRQGIKETLMKLLPGESRYVPLPPGGYPLPVIVKRKFSFPAQLKNISLLSLLPDFNSTQYDHLDPDLESPGNTDISDGLHPLCIRYSLIQPMNLATEQASRPSTPSSQGRLRRVKGRDMINASPQSEGSEESEDFTRDSESITDATTVLSITPRSVYTTPDTASPKHELPDLDAAKHQSAQEYNTDRLTNAGKIFLTVRDQITWKLKRCVPNLLRTFCIVDLQYPGHPIAVVSKGLLPNHDLNIHEAHILCDEHQSETSQIQVETCFGKKFYRLVLQGDLYSEHEHPTHRYLAHIDLTEYVESVRFGQNDIWRWEAQEPDLWLELAHEYMRENGVFIEDPPVRYEAKWVSKKQRLDVAMDVVKTIHQDFFVLGVSGAVEGRYEITHVSRSLVEIGREHESGPDLSSLMANLAEGQYFYSGLFWGVPRKVYCVPMFGPKLNSWLCFLVDESMPVVW